MRTAAFLTTCSFTLCLCLVAACAFGQASREFNWLPSGSIAVGNLGSEDGSDYRSVGEIIESHLAYSDGVRPDPKGRRTTEETFTVTIARWRGGPATGALVIRRRIDTAAEPVELTISIDGEAKGTWLRDAFDGDRRFADVFFVIPADKLPRNRDNAEVLKDAITVRIKADRPYDSYGYDLFITRDWNLLPEGYDGAVKMPIRSFIEPPLPLRYILGLLSEGDHKWDQALDEYKTTEQNADFELARCIRRRIRLCEYHKAASQVQDTREDKHFDAHYKLGLYCGANGFWPEAMDEYAKAVDADPSQADATYNLAEAMEYCYRPIAEWAPLMGQAGDLYEPERVNDVTVHVTINNYENPPAEDGTRQFAPMNREFMEMAFRDWSYVEQIVLGATRGTWRIHTAFEAYTPDELPWIMHLGWLWAPPDEAIPQWGMYDHTVSMSACGFSHSGGTDCGPAWSACCNVGPMRGWEVMLHEWNHGFDWTAICGEQGRGYPTTHDSDGCGKQPIVDMGCGHRSSMRYYLTPAQYRRIEPSDPDIPPTHIRTWAVYGPLDAPALEATTGEELCAELLKKKLATKDDVNWIRGQANEKKTDLADEAKAWYVASRQMDLVKATADRGSDDDEAAFSPSVEPKKWRTVTDDKHGGQVDLASLFPDAAPKAYAYAHVYIWSPDDREVRVWYGYHDGMRVWHNQRLVHESRYYNVARYEDPNWLDMLAGSLFLKKGWNSLLVKVERCAGKGGYGLSSPKDWSFSVNLVSFDNDPLPELKYQAEIPDGTINVYKRPEVGKLYRWADVKDDYLERLPQLTQDDFRAITGIPDLVLVKNAFLAAVPAENVQKGANAITIEQLHEGIGDATFEGEPVTLFSFLDLPIDLKPLKPELFADVTLNNFLNFDREAVGALRYVENGRPRDLLFIRPEFFGEFLTLLNEKDAGLAGQVSDRILGYWYINNAAYPSTPNRTWRAVIVAKTYLGDTYPTDEQDLLAVPRPPSDQ
jgi:tetratricopeptide (TPR) repeat protein